MRLHLIACEVMRRELSYALARSKNSISVTWLPQGLHNVPALLRKSLEEEIAAVPVRIEGQTKINGMPRPMPEAILLGYGLCSNGVIGLRAGKIPLVAPRTDDCIGIFLGSQKRYLEMFARYGGTYWLNPGWMETSCVPSEEGLGERREYYVREYGEDNADYIMEQSRAWEKNYSRCGYIRSPVFENEEYTRECREIAAQKNWDYFETDGSMDMVTALTEGEWNEGDFLVCPPFHRIEADYEGRKIKAVPTDKEEYA